MNIIIEPYTKERSEDVLPVVDFLQDLREETIAFLDDFGVKYKTKDELIDLLVKLFTFYEKYITPQKRRVYYSRELTAKTAELPGKIQAAISKMDIWVQDGIDINCFQSRGLYGSGSRDYQNALYGVVHLHLSADEKDIEPVKKGKFAKPSEYLLFALFQADSAYFLDVVHHPEALKQGRPIVTEWTSANILKIIESNWPELLEKYKLSISGLCDGNGNPIEMDDQAIASLTAHHITTIISGNQGFYMMRPGISSSGDSTGAVLSAQREIKYARQCEIYYKENEKELHAAFARILTEKGYAVPVSFNVHFDFIPPLNTMAILDRKSGMGYNLSRHTIFIWRNNI